MTVVETTTVTQVIECDSPEQAREMGEHLIGEGDIMSFGDSVLEDMIVDVEEIKGYADVDFDKWDVEEALG